MPDNKPIQIKLIMDHIPFAQYKDCVIASFTELSGEDQLLLVPVPVSNNDRIDHYSSAVDIGYSPTLLRTYSVVNYMGREYLVCEKEPGTCLTNILKDGSFYSGTDREVLDRVMLLTRSLLDALATIRSRIGRSGVIRFGELADHIFYSQKYGYRLGLFSICRNGKPSRKQIMQEAGSVVSLLLNICKDKSFYEDRSGRPEKYLSTLDRLKDFMNRYNPYSLGSDELYHNAWAEQAFHLFDDVCEPFFVRYDSPYREPPESVNDRAVMMALSGNTGKAEKILISGLQDHPDDILLRYNYGVLCTGQGRRTDPLDLPDPGEPRLQGTGIQCTRMRNTLAAHEIDDSVSLYYELSEGCLTEQEYQKREALYNALKKEFSGAHLDPGDDPFRICDPEPEFADEDVLYYGDDEEHSETNETNKMKYNGAPENMDLNELTKYIEGIREKLMKTVLGQDSAVNAFCSTLFNTCLAGVPEPGERRRPRAVYTLAGPPGVGKTLLAEEAAKALGLPFKKFDMSGYSDSNQVLAIKGFRFTYTKSAPGELTKFVYENPRCVLLFDEIEKAHIDIIRLFLQILDGGVLSDDFYTGLCDAAPEDITAHYKDDKAGAENALELREELLDGCRGTIPFDNAIIILTTNAGRRLYEDKDGIRLSALPIKTVLDELRRDTDPVTRKKLFPGELISRISTGTVLMFDHMPPHSLLTVAQHSFDAAKDKITDKYGIGLDFKAPEDKSKLLTSLLYSLGGRADARMMSAKAAEFVRDSVKNVITAADGAEVSRIYFRVGNIPRGDADIKANKIWKLFNPGGCTKVLVYSSPNNLRRISDLTETEDDLRMFLTKEPHMAEAYAKEDHPHLALIDISFGSQTSELAGTTKTITATTAASAVAEGWSLIKKLLAIFPDMPVYLLDDGSAPFGGSRSRELLTRQAVSKGVRGSFSVAGDDLVHRLRQLGRELNMQDSVLDLAARNKSLSFEHAVKRSGRQGEYILELRNFELTVSASADDMSAMVNDAERPDIGFDDVIGCAEAKKEIGFLKLYLDDPYGYLSTGLKRPTGVLLYGPEGTGKTRLAKAAAGEFDVAFLQTQGSILREQGSEGVRELFARARRNAPAIIFIDEIDSVGKQRTGRDPRTEAVLNTLLAEMDGFVSNNSRRPVVVIAATNASVTPDGPGFTMLDPALTRRFNAVIRMKLPSQREIIEILEKLTAHWPPLAEGDLKQLSEMMNGLTPSKIEHIVDNAFKTALIRGEAPSSGHIDQALQDHLFGTQDKANLPSKEDMISTAVHECGHALAYLSCGYTPAYLTIQARGSFGGYMQHCREEIEKRHTTKKDLLGTIRTCLGGRAAEEVVFDKDDVSTGAVMDLQQATLTAAKMIQLFGFDDRYGLMSFRELEVDEETKQLIRPILSAEYENAKEIIRNNRGLLDALVNALLKHGRLFKEQIEQICADHNNNNRD